MEILEIKAKVTILTVGKDLHDDWPGGGIMTLLERHGIAAQHLHRERGRSSIAHIIKETADEQGAQLIVMGAYEHSKFSQSLWGV